jgi:hypothetical protein
MMDKYKCDLKKIVDLFNNDKLIVKGNEHRMKRFAFDLFHVQGDSKDDLWALECDDDGNEFLVRTYLTPEEAIQKSSFWKVLPDKKNENLTIYFKEIPITKIASKSFIKSDSENRFLRKILIKKLSSDFDFVIKLFSSLPKEKRNILKRSGFFQSLKDWIICKDLTDPIMEKINKFIENNEHLDDAEFIEDFEDFIKTKEYKKDLKNEWKTAFLELKLSKK